MKRYFISFFLFVALYVHAQVNQPVVVFNKQEPLDTCLLEVTYRLKMVTDTLDRDERVEDRIVLKIGKQVSRNYSYKIYYADSLGRALADRGAESIPGVKGTAFPEEVFYDKVNRRFQVFYRACTGMPIYTYEEPVSPIAWKLTSQQKEIAGYLCHEAIGNFRGRRYTTYFTMDVPFPEGPYKFVGLPGLILSLSDDHRDYVWECIGLKKGSPQDIIYRNSDPNNSEIVETDRKQLRKIVAQMYRDMVGIQSAIGQEVYVMGSDGKYHVAKSGDVPAAPYNPLEME